MARSTLAEEALTILHEIRTAWRAYESSDDWEQQMETALARAEALLDEYGTVRVIPSGEE
jgi:hypothetical protein